MNATQIKCFLVMTVFEVIGLGPVCMTCLVGFYVVIARPRWFLEIVRKLYRGKRPNPVRPPRAGQRQDSGVVRVKCFLSLLGLFVLDIAPVPVAGTIGLLIVLIRPPWFYELTERLYGGMGSERPAHAR